MKRSHIFAVVVAILLIPAMVFSADSFSAAKATLGADNTVTVPLNVANQDGLMAIDIPLIFSEGVSLKEVSFENTRVEYFDLKIANIDNEENVVIIGLVTQISPISKPMLAAGSGTVANLVFEITDPSVTEFTIEAKTIELPHHELMFVYNRRAAGALAHEKVLPKFERVTVALSGGESTLPTEYALAQNYPNPFNPTTAVQFSLPVDGRVSISVFNVLGQQVVTLLDEERSAGTHTVEWDGLNGQGNTVSSGVYFYRISAGDFVQTKKMMMLK